MMHHDRESMCAKVGNKAAFRQKWCQFFGDTQPQRNPCKSSQIRKEYRAGKAGYPYGTEANPTVICTGDYKLKAKQK